jgi:hypothetical protein
MNYWPENRFIAVCRVAQFPAHMPARIQALLALLWLTVSADCVLAVPPSIETAAPLVVERGHTFELQIVGAGLQDCRDLVFYSDALSCDSLTVKDEYTLVAKITVKPDCPIANHAFRLLGTDGFSELKTLRVSRYPVVSEASRDSQDTVMDIPEQNVCVWGILEDGDRDRYRVQLKKGQRFTAEVEAIRLGGTLLDTVLSITDPQGRMVAFSDDGALLRQDPSITLVAPESGEYVVEVHETNYEGSSGSQYALYLGDFPAALVAFPAGGQLGTQVKLQFLSKDGQADLAQSLSLPSQADGFELFAMDEERRSASPVPFRLSNFANVFESEPDTHTDQDKQAYAAPIAFNGIWQTDGDIDFFALSASAGEHLRLEVFADRIGSPLDSLLQIFTAEGRLLARNDDHGSQDSRIDFRVPSTGIYSVVISDKLQRGQRTAVYRVEVQPIEPQLTAFLPRPNRTSQRSQAVAVPQGNRTLARVGVRREHVSSGDVQLRFENLPAGIHASPVYVPENEFWALAILEAEQDAPLGGSLANVLPTGRVGDQAITGRFEQVVDLVADSADRLYQAAVVERLAVAVTPAMPFTVELEQPQAELAVGGTIDLRVRVTRLKSFAAPILIEFPYLPDGCVGQPQIVIGPGETEGLYRISAAADAPLGDFHVAVIGRVALAAGRERGAMSATPEPTSESAASDQSGLFALADRDVASQLIDLRVMESPVVGNFDVLAVEQGTTLRVACRLQIAGQVPGRWKCELEGLPNRVTSAAIERASGEPRLEFEIVVPADVPVGTYQGIQCRLSGTLAGSVVSFVVPLQTEMQITEPGKLFRAADGRLLSPLEALRIQNAK